MRRYKLGVLSFRFPEAGISDQLTCLWSCNPSSCVLYRKRSARAWAAAARFRSMCGSSRRPTRSCGTWCRGRKFRADIYFRLNVFPILLPPLRERKDDILPLEDYFVQKFARQQGKSIDHITDEAIELLTCLDWPGSIRELQNVIERAVIITSGSVLNLHMTELMTHGAGITANKTLADAERAHILATLNETNWVVGGRPGAAM
jgi:transcriptional regulator of aromatic amino acid metabolism